jgi:TonB family protein
MSKYTILLIDYEPRSIESLKTPLESVGYDVVVASDGITGVEQFDSLRPDLTLVEAMIPKKHGFEVCQQLKATDHGRRSPIAILTAVYKGRKYRTQALHNYKCDEYLEKPIEADQLLQTVGRLLNIDDPYRPLGEDTPAATAVEVVQEVVPEPAEPEKVETETGFETTEAPIHAAAPAPKAEPKREPLPFDLTGADENEIMDRLDEILIEDQEPPAAAAGSPVEPAPAQPESEPLAAPTAASAAPILPQLEALDDGQFDEALSVLDAKIEADQPEATDATPIEAPPAEPTPTAEASPPEFAPTDTSATPAAEETGLSQALEGLAEHPAAEVPEAGRRDQGATADLVAAAEKLQEEVGPDDDGAVQVIPLSDPDTDDPVLQGEASDAPAAAADDGAPETIEKPAAETPESAAAETPESESAAAKPESSSDEAPDAEDEPATEARAVADAPEAEAKTGQVVDFDSHRSRKRRGKGKKAKGRKARKREARAANSAAATAPAEAPEEAAAAVEPAARPEPTPEPAEKSAAVAEPAASVKPAADAPTPAKTAAPSRGVPVWIWGVAALLIVGGAVGLFLLRGSGDGGSTPAAESQAPMAASTAPSLPSGPFTGSVSRTATPPVETGTPSPVQPVAEEPTTEPAAEPESTASAPAPTRRSEEPARAAAKPRPKSEPPAAATPKKTERASTREPNPSEPTASKPPEPKQLARTTPETKPAEPPARRIEIGEPEAARQGVAETLESADPVASPVESTPTESSLAARDDARAADALSSPEPTLKSFSKPAVTPPAPSRTLPAEPMSVEPEPVNWAGKLVDIRDVDVQPKVLDRRLPDYTHRAMRLKQQGTVELRVLVDEKGRVAKVEVTKPIPNSDLNDAAVDAVRRWKFSPATKEGQPVKTWKKETVTFKL